MNLGQRYTGIENVHADIYANAPFTVIITRPAGITPLLSSAGSNLRHMTAAGNHQCALSSIYAIFGLHQLRTVLSRISKAIIHVFIIGIINKQVIKLQGCIHREADDFVHVCFGNLIGIFCLNQCLLSIGQLNLGTQHVDLGYHANVILCLNIFQMVLQTGNGFRAEFLNIICLQHIKITVGNGRAHFVIGTLYANLIVLIVSLCLFNSTA